ncbi:MAG: DUF6034 family protein [Clostridia bacterium]|nr:DUF6034 family protein [Clostridia bacterium]
MQRLLAAILITLLLLTLACQPTPEEEPIVNRADSQAQEAIFSTTAPEKRVFPDRWDEEMVINDGVTVVFEASVEAESNVAHPIIEISRTSFDSETIVDIISSAFGNVRLREQEKSYDELLYDLWYAERGSFEDFDENGEAVWLPFDDMAERVAPIKEQLAKTPTVSTYIDFTAENLEIEHGKQFAVGLEDGSDMCISVYGSESEGVSRIWCRKLWILNVQEESAVMQGDAIPGEIGAPLENVKITQEEAESIAEEVLTRLGREDFALSGAFKARALQSWEIVSEGWILEYAPALGGTQGIAYGNYNPSGMLQTDETAYVLPWEPEDIGLYITENGIESFSWDNIYTIGEEVNPDVEIMPFDEVQTRIRNYFTYALSWSEGSQSGAHGTSVIYVTRVALTTSISQVENQTETAYLVPTWAIFYIGDDEREMYGDEHLLLINAIDGSLIKQYADVY